MRLSCLFALGLLVNISAAEPPRPAPVVPDSAALTRQLDTLLEGVFDDAHPGAAVLVARDGRPIYRRGFGRADLEHGTPITPETIFRIGSVTKQFTSALVLRLAEQGKLSLQDDIGRYLPDFPSGEQTTTIENLLTHTSGIASYTSLPGWDSLMIRDMTPQQLIDRFKNEPREFAPGTQFKYSNSGYFLLGVIVEKVTGRTYAECLQAEILGPLGMKHTSYGRSTPSDPLEALGYQREGEEDRPASPLSMTTPFAAGALVSSVDDLLLWDDALNAGRVLSPASLERAFAPFTLGDGHPTDYGCGWSLSDYEGHRIQEHGGGINGFSSHVLRMPDDHLYVALLSNTVNPDIDAAFLAQKIAAAAVGQPMPEPGAHDMTPEQLDRFTGVYRMDDGQTRVIRRQGDKLYSQRTGGPRYEVFPTSDSTFAYVTRIAGITFHSNARGEITGLTVGQSGNFDTAARTDEPIPPERVAISLEPAQLDACVGVYELAPTFRIAVTHEGARLMIQATGQTKLEAFPESSNRFFLKVVDALLEFQPGPDGRMASMTLHQGGRDMPAKRLP